MAINKNFVIKNGVQVDTDLIVGDSNTKKVGIGTTIPGYTLHVGATNSAGRGGIGATDINVTGVSTVQNLNVLGLSTFATNINANAGIVSAQSLGIGLTSVLSRDLELQNIASLDSTTTATIEEAIRVGPNSFSDLKVSGISTFVGIATFLGGIDVNIRSGVSTFSAPVQFGFAQYDAAAGLSSNFVAVGATVGFGTSAFFRDNAGLYFGDDSDLKIWHDSSNSYIEDVGTGDLIIRGSADIKLQSASGENYLIGNDTGSVEQYFDNSKKTETTSGGFKVTGITTLTNRLHVQAGVSTFDADVRYGIGATVGFGTSAFFLDDAAIFLGDDSDLKLHHDGSNSYIEDVGTGDLILRGSADIKLQSASGENYLIGNDTGSLEQYFDNSKKTETTSGGFKVTGITTLTNRLHVQAGVSTFDADVRFGIGATVGFGTSAFFLDDASINMGDDSDFIIEHDGSHSYINEQGTGSLFVQSNGGGIYFQKFGSVERLANFNTDGNVELFFDASKKVETTSGGLSVSGITTFSDRINVVSGVSTFQDSAKLTFGAQSDLSVWHDATNSYISNNTGELRIDSKTGERALVGIADSGVHIFYDNTKRLETISTGASVTGDLYISGDLFVSDDITYDEISGRTLKITGVGTFYDDVPLYVGDSQDLKIWHSSSDNHTRITEAGTGNLLIQGAHIHLQSAAGDETFATFTDDGAVSLYYDNANVFQTTPQGVNVTGVTTSLRLNVTGISTFGGNLDINASIDVSGATVLNGDVDLGNATSDTITATGRFDSDIVPSTDNARDLGASGLEFKDLYIDGTANIDSLAADTAAIGDLTDNRVVIAGSSGELEDDANFTYDGSKLVIGAGTGITVFNNGNATFSGITTAAASTVTGDLSVGGNLNVTGDISYDEVTGRNINISGMTTLGSSAGGGVIVTPVGAGATIGNANGAGIVTYYGDGAYLKNLKAGVGIGSTTGLVGYGFTYIHFNGPGVSTVYADTRAGYTGFATVTFQGGGLSGAAGTWAPYGAAGIATSKSVGVGTIGMGVTSLQGGVKGASSGIGNSFRGLYIGNGMMVVDNALNGNHYIGTSYNGLMAGPVTINGVLTVDGNYVVV